MFPVYTTPEELTNATITGTVILDLCLRKIRSGKSQDDRNSIVFEKLGFQNVYRPHEQEKPALSNSYI